MDETTKTSLSYGFEAYATLRNKLEECRQSTTSLSSTNISDLERRTLTVEKGLVHFIVGAVSGATMNTAAFIPPETLKHFTSMGMSHI